MAMGSLTFSPILNAGNGETGATIASTSANALVKSRVITAKKTEVPVEYRLHRLGDRWAAYDVLIDNVSLVSTYRSQFDRIIQSGGFSDLLKRMRDKEREGSTADAVIR